MIITLMVASAIDRHLSVAVPICSSTSTFVLVYLVHPYPPCWPGTSISHIAYRKSRHLMAGQLQNILVGVNRFEFVWKA